MFHLFKSFLFHLECGEICAKVFTCLVGHPIQRPFGSTRGALSASTGIISFQPTCHLFLAAKKPPSRFPFAVEAVVASLRNICAAI